MLDPILSDAKHHMLIRRWCRMPLELQNSTCSLAMLCEGEKKHVLKEERGSHDSRRKIVRVHFLSLRGVGSLF